MRTDLSVVIVGAGLSGIAAGLSLRDAGVSVHVLEKSRGLGGRMSTRRDEGWRFEHGAPHTASFAVLREAVTDVTRPLHISFEAHVQSLAPIAAGWEVRLADGRLLIADTLLLALPAPQAVALLDRGHDERDAAHDSNAGDGARAVATPLRNALAAVQMSQCWSVMFVVDGVFDPSAALQQLGDPALVVLAQKAVGPGVPVGSAWVAQMGAAWSAAHLEEEAKRIEQRLLDALHAVHPTLGVPFVRAHRWRYARVVHGLVAECLWMGDAAIGACGDWGNWQEVGVATVVESDRAIASGRTLARRVLAHYNIAAIRHA